MKIHIGIVEDNFEIIKTLKYILHQLDFSIDIVGEAQTMEEADPLLQDDRLELAFLDIQLRKGTTFEVLEKLFREKVKLPELVFITAHGSFEYALKAIQFACLDFVTKPFDKATIEGALQRYVKKKESKPPNQQAQVGLLLELLRDDMQSPKSIAVILSQGIIEFVELQQVMYFEADNNTTCVKLTEGKTLRSTRHLGYYIDLLMGQPEFKQISKSCLVNTAHLRQYNHREKTLLLKNGDTLIASHRFSRSLRKQLLESQQKQPGLFGKWFGT